MRVSATEEHGLRCLMRLAAAWQEGRETTLGEVAQQEGLTVAHVAKLVSMLRRAGLVRSIRGARGGVALSRDPSRIPLSEAMRALAGRAVRTGPCLDDGRRSCDWVATCRLRPVWMRVEETLERVLDGITLADVARNGRLDSHGGRSGNRRTGFPVEVEG